MNKQKDPQRPDPQAPESHEPASDLPSWAVWLQENRKLAIGALVVIAALVLGYSYFQSEDNRALDDYWSKVAAASRQQGDQIDRDDPEALPDPAILRQALETTEAGGATAWGFMMLAKQYIAHKDWPAAKETLIRIRDSFPQHWLNRVTDGLSPANESPVGSIIQRYLDQIETQMTWSESDQIVRKNPAPDQPIRAILETTSGEIELAFHTGAAPKHVSNFIRLALSGFYDGLTFHRVQGPPAGSIRTGDPSTAEGAEIPEDRTAPVITWEASRLYQFAGAVTQVRPSTFTSTGDERANQSSEMFDILLNDSHGDANLRTVFATVEAGLDVMRTIATADKDPQDPTVLAEPVRITRIRFTGGDAKTLLTSEDLAAMDK